ncbi:unnamed protein product, partial [Allacma fusca]
TWIVQQHFNNHRDFNLTILMEVHGNISISFTVIHSSLKYNVDMGTTERLNSLCISHIEIMETLNQKEWKEQHKNQNYAPPIYTNLSWTSYPGQARTQEVKNMCFESRVLSKVLYILKLVVSGRGQFHRTHHILRGFKC